MANPWEENYGGGAEPWSQTYEPVKPRGAIRTLADLGTGFASGAIGATKSIADAAGANNRVSSALDTADKTVQGWLSPQAQADQQEQQAILKDSHGKGVWEGLKAGARAFGVAPVQTAVQGLGSVVPIVAAGLGGLPAAAATGVAIGTGGIKGGIYDDVKQRSIEAGKTPQDAEAAALAAQEYTGQNTGQIALGGALGAADALTGVGRMAGGVARKALGMEVGALQKGSERNAIRRMAMGAAEEVPLEAVQGGQQQYATNVASQREGFKVDPWDGVVAQGAFEGLASAGPGAAFGAMHKAQPAVQTPPATQDAGTLAAEVPTPGVVPREEPTRSQAMGINPIGGPIQAAAAMAVDSGAHDLEIAKQAAAQDEQSQSSSGQADAVQPAKSDSVDPAGGTQQPNRALSATTNPQPTTMGTQTNVTAGPGFSAKDVVKQNAQAEISQPVATVATETPDSTTKSPDLTAESPKSESIQVDVPVTQSAQPGLPGEGAGGSQPTQTAPDEVPKKPARGPSGKADMEHLFGIPEKRAKAIARIAKGTAYFSNRLKAGNYIAQNGLKDTHEVVKHESGANRWDVRAKVSSTPEKTSDQAPKAVESQAKPEAGPDPFDQSATGGAVPAAPETAQPTAGVDAAAEQAATSPKNDLPQPTDRQKEAGNYAKGHHKIGGLDISIENPAGSERSGVDKAGKPWKNTLKHHYGYFKGTVGNDKDHVDVFVRPGTPDDFNGQVFVVNQFDGDKFDEHKVVIGAKTGLEARQIYQANYAKGWKGGRSITALAFDDFKKWVKDGTKNKPIGLESISKDATESVAKEGLEKMRAAKAAKGAQPRGIPVAQADTSPEPVAKAEEKEQVAPTGQARSKPQGGSTLRKAAYQRNPLMTFLATHGLFHDKSATNSLKSEFSPDRTIMQMGYGPVFKKTGLQLDALLPLAIQDGYLPKDATEQQLYDLIRKAMSGERVIPIHAEGVADAEMEKRAQAMQELADNAEPEQEVDLDAQAEREAIQAVENLPSDALIELDNDIILDAKSNTSTKAAMRALGFTKQEIQDAVAEEAARAQKSSPGRGQADEAGAEKAQAGAAQRNEEAGADAGLKSPTREDILASQDRAENAQALDDKAQIDREAAGQTLTRQNAPEQRKDNTGDMFGMEKAEAEIEARNKGGKASNGPSLFDEPQEQPAQSPETLRAQADLQNALADLADIFGKQGRAMMMPEQEQKLLPVLVKLFDAAFRLGYHKFKDAAKFALDQIRAALGKEAADSLTLDHLQGAYISLGKREGSDTKRAVIEVEDKAQIENHTAKAQNGAQDVPSLNSRVERNRPEPGAEPAVGEPVSPGRAGTDQSSAQDGKRVDAQGRGQPGDTGVSADSTPVGGERSDQLLRGDDEQPSVALSDARVDFGERSGDSSITGIPPDPIPASEVAAAAGGGIAEIRDRQQQRNASVDTKPGLQNVRETLPYLLEGQQEDVHAAETRFAKPEGYGMLFTNGTGTGKTFVGLGLVKRFDLQGKQNTLIVVPDDKIAADWADSGKALGLNITKLADTKDAGKGIVITTYANLGANDELAKRKWDLIVSDEAHSLMQSADAKPTNYLENLRAITHHPDGKGQRHQMLHRDIIDEFKALQAEGKALGRLTAESPPADHAKAKDIQRRMNALTIRYNKTLDAVRAEVDSMQGAKRTRVAFLSATPFAYEKTVDWANGYLFDYKDGYTGDETSLAYNQPDARQHFMMTRFGYSMRYNKLTEPDGSKIDRGILQRQFNGELKKAGVLAGRMLDVKPDYDRRFVLVDSAIGNKIDEAIEWLRESASAQREAQKDVPREKQESGMAALRDAIGDQFDYLSRRYLLEAIKAEEVVPIVKKHLSMGRKVVVFHDYKKGGAVNPFDIRPSPPGADEQTAAKAKSFNAAVVQFRKKFPELLNLGDLQAPIEVFKKNFPGVMLINGDEKKADLLKRYKAFQDDGTGPQVVLVQSAKNKGWSGHDTTGKHQRVLINLGQPTAPTLAIQQEGRIYRTGQVSNAIMRYLNTGTNWEKWAFATTIASRASTAENLGMGELSRALKDSFIAAFDESDAYPPGHEGEGTGGKERDKASNNALTEYDRAKTHYWATQKKNSKTKAQEGVDYFATPEPIGLKMVQWLDARGEEDTLEPSAGHGAIARWLPETTKRTAIEPSTALRSRLAMVMNPAEDRIIDGTFEDLAIVNKFDGIVMNPPFGSGGKTAIDHLAKAATHLRDGGRIVALIPTGPAADKKFDKWFYEEFEKPAKPLYTKADAGPIYKGDTVFYRDVNDNPKKLVVSQAKRYERSIASSDYVIDGEGRVTPYGNITRIEAGPRTESYRPGDGLHLIADIKLPQVTFERAGTAVTTRIVVIEKHPDGVVTAPSRDRDYSDITDINELFDELENLDFSKRAKPEVVQPKAPKLDTRSAKLPDQPAKPMAEVGDMVTMDGRQWPIVIVKTKAGKELRGIIRPDLTKTQAQATDEFTYIPYLADGSKAMGYFIREKHLTTKGDDPTFSRTPFYSALTREVSNIPAKSQSGMGWTMNINGMVKAGKVKQDEVEWSGIIDYLKLTEGKIGREQVVAFLEQNGVQVTETVLGKGRDNVLRRREDAYAAFDRGEITREERNQRIDDEGVKNTKYDQYQLPGGSNYREVLLTLPNIEPTEYRRLEDASFDAATRGDKAEFKRLKAEAEKIKPAEPYKSSHWEQPNVLAHIRLNDRISFDEPRRGIEARDDVFPAKVRAQLPLDVVQGGVLAAAHDDHVRKAIVAALPIDVVDTLRAEKAAPEDLFGNDSVRLALLTSADGDFKVLPGLVAALRQTEASIGAKIRGSLVAGLDENILPALRTSDFQPGIISRFLSNSGSEQASKSSLLNSQFGSARSGATLTGTDRSSSKSNGADGASLIQAHSKIISHRDRTDADGKRVLFVEELQSDWGQDGKKKGFNSGNLKAVESIEPLPGGGNWWNVVDSSGAIVSKQASEKAAKAKIEEMTHGVSGTVPSAPFVTATDKWLTLALKRIMVMASQEGYDKVAFVNGEQSAERYDLSQQIDRLQIVKSPAGTYTIGMFKNERSGEENLLQSHRDIPAEKLEDYVGKQIAKQAIDGQKDFSGDGLKIGGEGMKAFYDKIVPNTLKDVLRKVGGGQMEAVSIGIDTWRASTSLTEQEQSRFLELNGMNNRGELPRAQRQEYFSLRDKQKQSEGWDENKQTNQPGFTITDAMKQKASQGLPLFSQTSQNGGNTFPTNEAHRDQTDKLQKALKGYDATVTPVSVHVDAAGDGSRGTRGRGASNSFSLAEKLAGIFGKEIVWFTSKGAFSINGVVVGGGELSNYVFINANAKIPAHVILGHELTHHIEKDAPGVYKALVKAMNGLLRNHEGYRQQYGMQGESDLAAAKEMIGDLMGDNFDKREFWNRVSQESNGLSFQMIARSVMKWLDGLLVKLKLKGFGSDQFVTDIHAARKALATALVDYKESQGKPARTMDGDVAPEFSQGGRSADDISPGTDYSKLTLGQAASAIAKRMGALKSGEGASRDGKASRYYDLPDKRVLRVSDHEFPRQTGQGVADISVVIEDGEITVTTNKLDQLRTKIESTIGSVTLGLKGVGQQNDFNGKPIPGWHKFDGDTAAQSSALAQLLTRVKAGENPVTTLDEIVQQNDPTAPTNRTQQTDTTAFRNWFGKSVLTEDGKAGGKPLVLWRGEQSGDRPNTYPLSATRENGVFLTPDKKAADGYDKNGESRPFYVRGDKVLDLTQDTPQNRRWVAKWAKSFDEWVDRQSGEEVDPFDAVQDGRLFDYEGDWSSERWKDLQASAQDDGFNVLVAMDTLDGMPAPSYIALDGMAQLKSATENNGDFDPTNPDIRFSRSIGDTLNTAVNSVKDVKLPAGYLVGDLINSAPGKLNWWHKTIGTQYNLAQRSAPFKRVFDSVQNFINDVSFYATEAADLAPNILPKLETWKDITKAPLSAQDTKAISAPIFEGTLTWGRDESGKPIKMADLEAQAAQLTVEQKAQRLMRNDHISEQVLKMWQGLPIDQFEVIINGKYERDMLKAGVVWTPAELKAMFGLTDKQVSLYQEFRTATDKSLTNLAVSDMLRFGGDDVAAVRDKALAAPTADKAAGILADHLRELAELIPERNDVLLDTADRMIEKSDRAIDLIERGYAPLSRFGQYTLDVVHDGERVYFGMFENKFDASRMAREMEKQFPGAQVTRGTVSEQAYKMFAGVSPETLELFGNMLGLESGGDAASAQAFQTYLKLAKSNRSSMKRLIERKGISGFSEDSGRVLAGFVYSNARQTASNLHMGEMTQAAADNEAFGRQGELQDAAVKLVDYIKNPQEEAQQIRGLLFAQYIGGSVASAMVNLTQPLTMTFPWLSQYGGVKNAARQMAAATKDALKKTTGDKALDAALHRAEEDGTVSPQEVHQLMQQSMGKGALRSGDGTKAGDAMALAQNSRARVSLAWGKLFSVAEQFNRRSTFIAAYRTAVAEGMPDPDAFARKAIAETQGVYNKGNKPAWARGALGSTLFTFKQFSISYVEMLSRMAKNGPEGRKAALLALGVLFLLSGAGGMPGADDLDDLISGALQGMGYNFDSKAKRREFFAGILGEGGAQFMERGISGLPGAPIDVSGRMGLGNLIPGTGLFTKKTDHTSDVAEIAGPAGDLAKRTFTASGQLVRGEVGSALNSVSAKAIQNLTQAYDMANMGMYRDQSGKKVIDTDASDAVAKAIGFQPNDVKKVQDATREVQRMIALNKMRETEIADEWAKGMFEKDPSKVQAAREDLAQWNADNPESQIRISFAQIIKRLKAMNQTKEERLIKTAPKEIRNTVRQELMAAR